MAGASEPGWDCGHGRGERRPGFNFPAENRRKTGNFSVSASSREMEFRYFSSFSVFKFKNSKIFVKNWEKI